MGAVFIATGPSKLSLQWCQYEHDDVSYHRRLLCLLNCRFRHRSKKTSKLRVTGLTAGNSPVTGEFPRQRASNAENVSIWWRHHVRAQRPMKECPCKDVIFGSWVTEYIPCVTICDLLFCCDLLPIIYQYPSGLLHWLGSLYSTRPYDIMSTKTRAYFKRNTACK